MTAVAFKEQNNAWHLRMSLMRKSWGVDSRISLPALSPSGVAFSLSFLDTALSASLSGARGHSGRFWLW